MTREELIELLESKSMDNGTINEILKFSGRNPKVDIKKTLAFIYGIFSYIGLSDEQIELLLFKYVNILKKPQFEVVKIAYVLHNIGLSDEIFSAPSTIYGICNYKKAFIRNILASYGDKRGGIKNSVSFLVCDEKTAYTTYGLSSCALRTFDVLATHDNEVEAILNTMLKICDEPVSVDEYISKKAMLFYNKYLLYQKTKHKEGMSK